MRTSPEPAEPGLERAVALLTERFRPSAIVLFGSRARAEEQPASDYDIGSLLATRTPDPFDVSATEVDLEDVLGAPVDLVVLDHASPILAMEVLRSNRMLREDDPERFETFVVKTLGAYFDLKRVRPPIEAALLRGAPA